MKEQVTSENVGKVILAYREKNLMSIRDFAKISGISARRVWSLEKEIGRANFITLSKVKKVIENDKA